MKVLFINHSAQRCGVADYGRRAFEILRHGMDVEYCDTPSLMTAGFDAIIYNYHHATMPDVLVPRDVKTFALFHEGPVNAQFYLIITVESLARPLPKTAPWRKVNGVPVIGSFGFGFPDKDFPRICRLVREQYKQAHIRLHIPFAQFGDADGSLAMAEVDKCWQELSGSNIQLTVTHEHKETDDLVQWLSCHDLNLFLYKPSHGRGVSSAIDYALASHCPIGISDSEMFRHLPRDLVVDGRRLPELTIEPLFPIYEQNSNERFIAEVKEAIGYV